MAYARWVPSQQSWSHAEPLHNPLHRLLMHAMALSAKQMQCWRRNPSMEHFPVWVKMRAHMRAHKSFGIYHETFKVDCCLPCFVGL